MNEIVKIKDITFVVKDELEFFEKKIKKILDKNDNFLKKDLNDFIFSNPKRLRPLFVFLFAKILKIKDFSQVFNIALTLEFIHSASLIHDDILDNEKIRRSNPTFYEKYGAKLAVLEGDLLLSMALNVLSETNLDILKIFSNKIQKTLDGEIEQNSFLNKVIDEKKYLEKTFNKTGNLFFAGLESLFTLENFDNAIKIDLENFLKNYTLAFQIKNDIDNIQNKNSSDIKNGNYTLPVLYFCKENNIDLLDCKNDCFQNCIDLANKKVCSYKEAAINFLDKIEDTVYKSALVNLCNYTLRS